MDAICKHLEQPLHRVVKSDALGIRWPEVHSGLEDHRTADILPPEPLESAFIRQTVGLADPAAAETEANAMATRLRERATERGTAVTVVGPAPAYIARRADRWRWNIVLRGSDPVPLLAGALDAPWSVHVDAESLH